MHPRIKAAIIADALATPTVETCGFILADHGPEPFLHPCANVSPEPERAFEIDVQDHIAALGRGRILGVYHSHPRTIGFSHGGPGEESDMTYAEEMAVPMYLYCVADGSWHSYLPAAYQPPLTGRAFVTGFEDCYEQVRLWARQKHAHHMADYDRDREANLRDLILARFDAEGFVQVPLAAARLDDVLMFESERVLSNHFGVLTGPNRMLHHPLNGLSREEQVTDKWLGRVVCAFRLRKST